jgi:type II secretory pathway pseudopilin PulG
MRFSLQSRSNRGTTLVELSATIGVIVLLAGIVSISVQPFMAYRDGRAAGEALRAVKAAQLMYLADHPARSVASLTQDDLLLYMPQGSWPTLPKFNGQTPTIVCNQFPPVTSLGSDPSGATDDGLWDAGKY